MYGNDRVFAFELVVYCSVCVCVCVFFNFSSLFFPDEYSIVNNVIRKITRMITTLTTD